MYISRDPSKSRPLSKNVKRLMRLERASPENKNVFYKKRVFTENDGIYCHKQGGLFMEASAMGLKMKDFAPKFMQSQLAGVIDYSFSTSNGINDELSGLLQIPVLLENPRVLVEALYWIDEIISHTDEYDNKSLVLSKAYEAEKLKLPEALAELPERGNKSVRKLSYAYWLGYIYRYECILHEESSRMVYGAFKESIMKDVYKKLLDSPLAEKDLSDSAADICSELDRLLVEKIWPAKGQREES